MSFTLRVLHNRVLLLLCSVLLSISVLGQTGSFTPLTHLATHNNSGEMILMTDGTVLCKTSTGGTYGTTWDKLTPNNGSYLTGTWSTIATMAKDRLYFSSQVLPDGRLYVCGGEYGSGGSSGEVYDPKTNTWTTTGGAGYVFPQVVSDANSEILYNGKVLQASVDESGVNLNYLWDPVTNTYTAGPNCLRIDNEAMWVKLPDSSILFLDNYGETSERYMPKTNTWINDGVAPVDLYDPYGSEAGAGFLLPDGRVFFIGSLPNTLYYTPSGSTAPGTWVAGPNIPSARGVADGASAMMPNGIILMAVSPTPTASNSFPSPTYYYEFDYTTNTFTEVNAPGGGLTTGNACYISNMLDLPDGTVLFCNQGSKQYYQYTPGTGPLPAGQPTISTVNRINCDTFQVTGTLFNGICEGAGYGDDWQMETNYPIVRLTAGGNTYYATTYNWNRIGAVMTGALPDTAIFVIPAALVPGTYSVTVVANGNPSTPFTINTSLTIAPTPVTVCVGGTTTLTDVATIGAWSSANTGIATVGSATGVVTGTGLGTTTISYSIGQCSSTVTVTVNGVTAPITGTLTVCQGATTPLTDAVTGGTWSSSNGNATVGSSGIVTGVNAGTSTISYVAPSGCSNAVVVTVNPTPTATITPLGSTTFCSGSNVTLDANTGAGLTYQWQLGGSNIAGATNSSYVATLGGNYTVIVTNASGCSATSAITVVTTTAGPGAIITPAGPTTFCTGGSVVLNANTGAGLTYQWQLGGVNIPGATLSSYTATSGGSYVVIVTQGVCVATSSPTIVTVNTAPTVTPINGSLTVCTGLTTTLTDGTGGGTWASSNIAKATVGSSSGVVTGVATGTTTITYTFTNTCGSIFTTSVVTVNASSAVAVISGSVAICIGGTTPLSDATAAGVWSSSNTGVATVSGSGLVTGASAGTALISYTVTNAQGCVNSAVVTVTVSAPFAASITPAGSTTFCSGGFVILNATVGAGYTYQWQSGGINIPGATNASYTASTGGNYTVIINSPTGCATTTAGIVVTVLGGSITTPAVSISASFGDTVCITSSASTFTAIPVNGGAGPTYQWFVNGASVGVGSTYTYLPANGDIIKCILTSNATCAFPTTASDSITMTVSPLMSPSVSITSIHGDSTCTGDTVQFAAVPVYGGTAPTYLWTENGINVATGPYYIYAPHDGDTLIVTMTSNYPCVSPSIVASNIFIIHAFTPTVNMLSVSVSQSSILSGRVDTFTAIATGAGTAPSFQWYINGNPVAGATSYRYITDSLKDGQIVNCGETSNFICSEPRFIFSGGISITVLPNSVKQIGTNTGNFTLVPNPNNGEFTIKGSLVSPSDDRVNIVITNVLGQSVYKKTVFANNGNVNEQINEAGMLATGTYQVSITSGEGRVVFHIVIEK